MPQDITTFDPVTKTVLTPTDLQPVLDRLTVLELRPAFDPTALQNRVTSLESRVAALEAAPPPEPPPPPPPPPPGPPVTGELNLKLLGGYKLAGEYLRGSLAIDHTSKKAIVGGFGQTPNMNEYQLGTMGTGDPSTWPTLPILQTITPWWDAAVHGGAFGLAFQNGQFVAAPRYYYDMNPPATTTIFSRDGSQQVVNVPRQQFAGFVKGAGTLELGGGGYESGQGTSLGPTLATLQGQKLIGYSGGGWDQRCPRPTNYHPHDGKDSWVCLAPRNGEGRWACDRIWAGGIRHSTGIYYWAWMGTGDLNYARQNETFGADGLDKCYRYRYDPVTYQLIDFKEQVGWNKICGQDISPDGKYLYVIEGTYWTFENGVLVYKKESVLKVFEILTSVGK